jgi:proteasome lid subunit RPN8/RPN11
VTEIASRLKSLYDPNESEERCGLILDNGDIVETPNKHEDPKSGFVIDPVSLLEFEDKMVGTWHTHPAQKANLSQEDYVGFLNWPSLMHFIIGVDGVRLFVVEDGLVIEEDIGQD